MLPNEGDSSLLFRRQRWTCIGQGKSNVGYVAFVQLPVLFGSGGSSGFPFLVFWIWTAFRIDLATKTQTIEIDDDTATALKQRAEERGVSVPELVAEVGHARSRPRRSRPR